MGGERGEEMWFQGLVQQSISDKYKLNCIWHKYSNFTSVNTACRGRGQKVIRIKSIDMCTEREVNLI